MRSLAAVLVLILAVPPGPGSALGDGAPSDAAGVGTLDGAREPKVVQLAEQPILRRRIKAKPAELEAKLREAFFAVLGEAMKHRLELTGPPLARYQSRGNAKDPTFVVDAALPIRARAGKTLAPGFAFDTLAASKAASLTHRGRLADLPRTHQALDTWIAAKRRRPVGARWEVFVTNPVTTPDPSAQEVTVVVPLTAR